MSTVTSQPAASAQLLELPRRLEAQQDFVDLLAALQAGQPASIDGAWGSACALAAAALANASEYPLVVVLSHQRDIDDFCDDLALFYDASASAGSIDKFPAWESQPDEQILHDDIYADRLRTLKALQLRDGEAPAEPDDTAHTSKLSGRFGRPDVIVTSIQSLQQPAPHVDAVAAHTRVLRVGQRVDAEELRRWLVEQGFHATTAVELPGEFSSRGGIVDVFSPDWYAPVRIELFGDQIESLRSFDVATQRSLESHQSVEITLLRPAETDREFFTSYLPEGARLMLVEPKLIQEEGQNFLHRVEHAERVHSVPQVLAELKRFPLVTVSGIGESSAEHSMRLPVESVERFSGEISKVREELETAAGNCEVFIVCQTEGEIDRLREVFAESALMQSGRLQFVLGRLRSGFRLIDDGVVLISGAEMFDRADVRRPAPRRHMGRAIDTFMDLREGDLVVHLAHGIGRYRGIELLSKDGQTEEHLQIEFHGRTKVYVPATKIDLVQKYVGGRRARPSLAKIGGKTWAKQKRAAEAAVNDLAAEMIELQAERQARPGIPFAADTDWQREFDALFPYHETPDQITAIRNIKQDMQTPRPMDRLLCGDVGFGKTEMAIRAAFKAVDNGYQVAVLVPTTVLAEQHYHTFSQRMAEFPFHIARLSRFCSSAEEREILEGLKRGSVDVVIGTHRLASQDVEFENLGLVIIDEEQRFGVEVKERLKTLRATVDVLTMTATPIPRTLHMSLVGLRDISNLETPPEERIAVETKIARRDEELIRHAVLRELSRGGQVFFVHNRVGDIHIVERWLQRIVPEANIRVGHGQMPEGELEQVMVDFVAGRFDVLLATTIVESGLDIPNANTIFIDEADRYGLADLHQLRGRVGRYKHRAYCYLLLERDKHVTPNAARRLRAIEEFSDMGAGFALAMRDLEIRGAGNILGAQQSGHIAAVGYEFYCELMEKCVRRLKKMPPKMTIDVTIELPGEAYLPREYVPDMRMKIDLYKRMTRISGDRDLQAFREELIDRFGPLPPPVKRLLSRVELKIDAAVWQIQSIHMEGRDVVFTFADRERMEQLARLNERRLRLVDDEQAYLRMRSQSTPAEQIVGAIKSVLRVR